VAAEHAISVAGSAKKQSPTARNDRLAAFELTYEEEYRSTALGNISARFCCGRTRMGGDQTDQALSTTNDIFAFTRNWRIRSPSTIA